MLSKETCLRWLAVFLLVGICFIAGFLLRQRNRKQHTSDEFSAASLAEFVSLNPIDVHTHILQNGPVFQGMLRRLNLHVVDILYVDDTTPYVSSLETEKTEARNFAIASEGRAAICTTFDPYLFNRPNFAENAIAGLDRDFQDGVVAVKVWKNVGMEIKNSSGKYVMADDPVFEPIYRLIAAHNRTLMSHQADPDRAWGKPDPSDPEMAYFTTHPQWSMLRTGAPEKATILRARDHVLAMNPDLRIIGAHFGSQDQHLDQLGATLDSYPNFAVDTAARIKRLVTQPRNDVREFFLKYQDRILYGTDLNFYNGADDSMTARTWERQYARNWRYLSTEDHFQYDGHPVVGLNLPKDVLRKVYRDNAIRWIPGLSESFSPRAEAGK